MHDICRIYSEVGLTAYKAGDLPTATKCFEDGLVEARRQKLEGKKLLALMQNLALVYVCQDRIESAIVLLEQASKTARLDAQTRPQQKELSLKLADLYFRQGRFDQCEYLYRKYLLGKSADGKQVSQQVNDPERARRLLFLAARKQRVDADAVQILLKHQQDASFSPPAHLQIAPLTTP